MGYVAFLTKGQTTASKLAEENDKHNIDPLPEEYTVSDMLTSLAKKNLNAFQDLNCGIMQLN